MDKKEFQLIEKCKSGNTNAKEQIYKKYAPVLLGICMRYIKNRMEAEDVLHESFIAIFENINQLKNTIAFEGWIKRITINNSLKHLKSKEHLFDFDAINEPFIDAFDKSDNKNIKERILQSEISQQDMLLVINNLPTGFRSVFNLYVFEKHKHSKIASKLGISVGTSKSQLLRARKLIQKNLYELVTEKEKNKKREQVLLTSFIVFMNNDLDYIDKLAHDKLNNFASNPITNAESIINNTNLATWSLKGKIASIINKKVIWYAAATVGASAASFIVVSNNNRSSHEPLKDTVTVVENNSFWVESDTNNKVNSLPLFDTLLNSEPNKKIKVGNIETNKTIEAKKNKKDTLNKKVYVKKVIKIKKRKILTDTIRRTDTLHLQ